MTACLRPGHAADEGGLDVLGQRGGEAVEVHLVRVLALGLDEDLVPFPLGKAHDLVLDRGAVARALALDSAAVEGRAAQARADDRVRRSRSYR